MGGTLCRCYRLTNPAPAPSKEMKGRRLWEVEPHAQGHQGWDAASEVMLLPVAEMIALTERSTRALTPVSWLMGGEEK